MASRREFCKSTILAAGACSLGGAFLLNSCGTSKALTTDYSVIGKELKIRLSAFSEKSHLVFDDNKLEIPVYVSKHSEIYFQAFLMKCTHRNCTVTATGPVMVCPCHGSEFNNKGQVLTGPASEPLLEFKIKKTESELIVAVT